MNGNTFGTIFRVTTWGESHGPALGAIIDGCPSGIPLKPADFAEDMQRRQGGNSAFTTARKEADVVEMESGVFEGITTGTPIALRIKNENMKSADYAALKQTPRPGHADLTTILKQGHRDPRGGGRSSARETAARVAAAVVAKKILAHFGIELCGFVARIGELEIQDIEQVRALSPSHIRALSAKNPLFLPLELVEAKPWLELVERVKENNDSLGGSISCLVRGLPAGLGEPVFDKLNALLAHAVMSLPAATSCEIGSGRRASFLRGSEIRDPIGVDQGKLKVQGTKHGGLLGGISTGEQLTVSVDFHAPTSIPQEIASASFATLKTESVSVQGRHDSTPLPRAVPMVEAMVALTLVDALLRAGRVPEKLVP
jgi:chorismate synthase